MTLDVPRRILVLGGGGREHALAWRLAGELASADGGASSSGWSGSKSVASGLPVARS